MASIQLNTARDLIGHKFCDDFGIIMLLYINKNSLKSYFVKINYQ